MPSFIHLSLHCFALHCFALLYVVLLCVAYLCMAWLCFILHCFAFHAWKHVLTTGNAESCFWQLRMPKAIPKTPTACHRRPPNSLRLRPAIEHGEYRASKRNFEICFCSALFHCVAQLPARWNKKPALELDLEEEKRWKKNVFIGKRSLFWGLGEVWVPGWNQGGKKGEKGKFTHPMLEGILVYFVYVYECVFSCIF